MMLEALRVPAAVLDVYHRRCASRTHIPPVLPAAHICPVADGEHQPGAPGQDRGQDRPCRWAWERALAGAVPDPVDEIFWSG